MTREKKSAPPSFDAEFRAALRELILWRRDVRRFKTDPVDPALILSLIELAARSPVRRLQSAVAFRAGREPRAAGGHSRLVRARQRRGAEPVRRRASRPLRQAETRGAECGAGADRRVCRRGHGRRRRSRHATRCRRRYATPSSAPSKHCGWRRGRMGSVSAGCRSSSRARSPPHSMCRPRGSSSLICASDGRPRSISTPSSSGTVGRSASIPSPLILRR